MKFLRLCGGSFPFLFPFLSYLFSLYKPPSIILLFFYSTLSLTFSHFTIMLLKYSIKLLSPRSAQSVIGRSTLPSLIVHRSFTSSRHHFKAHNGGTSTGSNCSGNDVDDEEKLSTTAADGQEPFISASTEPTSLPFMPVVHIPQTEFAHNAFFSLHRPLLGLEDDKMDKPFFSNHAPEEDLVSRKLRSMNYGLF